MVEMEIQSDVSAVLLELLHIEIVSHLSCLDPKECQVSCDSPVSRDIPCMIGTEQT